MGDCKAPYIGYTGSSNSCIVAVTSFVKNLARSAAYSRTKNAVWHATQGPAPHCANAMSADLQQQHRTATMTMTMTMTMTISEHNNSDDNDDNDDDTEDR
jgi:hypothetical protein